MGAKAQQFSMVAAFCSIFPPYEEEEIIPAMKQLPYAYCALTAALCNGKKMPNETSFPMRNILTPLALAVLILACVFTVATPAYATFPGRNGRIAFAASDS